MSLSVARVAIATLGVAVAAVSLTAQGIAPIGARVSSSGTVPVSPSVVATYLMSPGGGDLVKLEAAVFWRGRPGWATALRSTGTDTTTTLQAGSVMTSGGGGLTTLMNGVELTVRLDRDKSILFVRNQGVDLRTSNVVLVDFVDEGARATIVDSLRMEAQLPLSASPDALLPIVNASPVLKDFLRCDVNDARLPIPTMLCSRMQR